MGPHVRCCPGVSSEPETPRSKLLETAKTVGLAVLFALGVPVGIAQAYVVEGPSMEPSLVNSQRLFVLRAAYGLSVPFRSEALATWASPEVGDVVVIESPVDGIDLVKRVVGVPGDVIEVRDGVLVRNGEEVRHARRGACDPADHMDFEPGCEVIEERLGGRAWTTSRAVVGPWVTDAPAVTVPEGHVYVMGDHRDRSNDSRAFGPVPMDRLRGRVLFVD